MQLRFFQLNIYKGKFLPHVIKFIKENNIHIVCLQEVTGGSWSYEKKDCVKAIKEALGYNAEIVITWKDPKDTTSYFGNATFFDPTILLKEKKVLWLEEFAEVENKEDIVLESLPRAVLDLQFEIEGMALRVLNTHLAWGKNDKDDPNKLSQGKKLYEYVKTIHAPYILSGDFNVSPTSQIVSWVSELSRNLLAEYQVKNTLNHRTHYARKLFPQGLAVDYIFSSPTIRVNEFKVIQDIDLSDHFGLLLDFEL